MLFKGTESIGTLDWNAEKEHLEKIRDLYEKLFGTTDEADRKKIFAAIDEENKLASKFAIPNELDKLYKTLGFGDVNAYTSDERTVYTLDFPKNQAEKWAAIESERFLHPVFRLFQTELESVYEEKNRSMDSPDRAFYEAYAKALYPEHPYSTPTLGTMEHLKNPSLKKMYEFYNRYYCPNNMAIVAAGDFDSKEMLELIKKYFSVWQPKQMEAAQKFPLPPVDGIRRVNVQFEAEEAIIIGWLTVKNGDPDEDALTLMDMLISNRTAGILDLYLNQQQRVKNAGSYPSYENEAGSWQLYGSPKDGQSLEEVEALLMEVVTKIKNGEFEQSDIDAVITDMEVERKRGFEHNESRVGSMVASFASHQDWADEAGRLDRMKKLTKADVLRVAAKYLTDNRVVTTRTKGKPEIPTITKPEFTKIPIKPEHQSGFYEKIIAMSTVDIEPRWIAEGKDYQVREGAWGKLVAAKNPIHDLFSLSFTFDIGTDHEKELGYASRLWSLAGAGSLDAEAFRKKLYSLGSSMHFSVGDQRCSASISGLEAHYDETLALLRQKFMEPNIRPDDLEKMIVVELGERKDSKTNPDSQQAALREWAMHGKESAILKDLTNEELQKLDAGRLKTLLAGILDYRADVSYTGLRDIDDVVKSIAVDGRKYKNGYKYRPEEYVKPKKNRILFLHRDMVQSKVGMFTLDEKWNPRHWADYAFYSQYMGGGMSSVLFQEVRESRALAYVVGGGYGQGGRPKEWNLVSGGLGTQADKTVEGASLVRSLLANLPADQGRFAESKDAIEQAFRTSPLTYGQIPGTVHLWDEAGFDTDPRPDRMQAALKYELKDLERFSDKFKDKDWTIYILGNKERVDMKALSALGEIEMVELDSLYPY
jgi:predicted Zn-dependent peptidase